MNLATYQFRAIDYSLELLGDGSITHAEQTVYIALLREWNNKGYKELKISCRFFATGFNISINTYRKSLIILESLGLIKTRKGSNDNTFVTLCVSFFDTLDDTLSDTLSDTLDDTLDDTLSDTNNILNTKELNTNIDDVAEATQPAPQIELFEKNYPIKKKRKPREPKVVIPFVAPTFDEVVKFGIQQAVIDGSTSYEGEMTGKKFYFKMLAKGWANDKGVHTKDWRGDLMIWIYNIKLFKKDKPQSGTDGVRSAQSRPLGLD